MDARAPEVAGTSSERPATASGRAVAAGWTDSLARCLELAGTYAVEQGLLRSPPTSARSSENARSSRPSEPRRCR